MEITVDWSELIVEKGTKDPLGLWRVSDRLAAQLLSPFTTVVGHRPARYFSMYSWLLNYLNSLQFQDMKSYWKRFYQLEAVFLCAIQLHDKHNYDYFKGQIGSESAKKILSKQNKGEINISKSVIQNGWEPNYKNSLYQLKLIETDFGQVSGIRVTDRGKKIAECYGNTIRDTSFYKTHLRSSTAIPINSIRKLAEFSCPCLLYGAKDTKLIQEKDMIIGNSLKTVPEPQDVEFSELLSSILAICDCVKAVYSNGYIFDKNIWHGILSTGLYGEKRYKNYSPPDEYKDVFRKWEIYTFELILVYSLEAALSGFLDYLNKSNGYMSESDLQSSLRDIYKKQSSRLAKDKGIELDGKSISSNIDRVFNSNSIERLEIEYLLIGRIETVNDAEQKMIYAFILYLYAQALFIEKSKQGEYCGAIKNYNELSSLDGKELSLRQTTFFLEAFTSDAMEEFFMSIYMSDWIVQRQLTTRFQRGKEVAWFSYNNELKTYNWESPYASALYRASRLDILMTYLLNLDIVKYDSNNKGWFPNLDSSFYKS